MQIEQPFTSIYASNWIVFSAQNLDHILNAIGINKCSGIAQEKSTLTRRALQEAAALISTLSTQLGVMLTSKKAPY